MEGNVTKLRVAGAATAVLVLCAIGLTGMSIHDAYGRWTAPPSSPWYIVPDWTEYARSGHRYGPQAASVVVVAFLDYQCAACRRLEGVLEDLLMKYAGNLGVVLRHFPLPGHATARSPHMLLSAPPARGASSHSTAISSPKSTLWVPNPG
jgi:hypothetical protein